MEREAIGFQADLYTLNGATVLRLPQFASKQLPSRGQVAVRGTINGAHFETVLEPDGEFGHWMRMEESLLRSAGVGAGDRATLDVKPVEEWPEPVVPDDLDAALRAAPEVIQYIFWEDITPMARWEWVRWVNATRNPETRKRRIAVTISKMQSGKRRPCCFNLAGCTDPDLSKSGKLLGLG